MCERVCAHKGSQGVQCAENSLKHELGEELLPLLLAYRDAVNRVLEELWGNIEWKKRKLPGKKQWRLLPKYKVDIHSKEYKRKLRESLLEDWDYAAHWVDSAIKTAYSILKSWRKNYVKGERKRRPTARRLFVRAKQTLIKLEGEKLRLTIKPGEYVYLDLSKRYFPLPHEVSSSALGEPVITLEKVHLPVHYEDDTQSGKPSVAWDFNLLSLDGYSPETGWVRIDTKKLASVHISSFEKRRAEEGFTLEKSKKSSFKVLQQRKEPCEKTPARNRACHSINVWFCGSRRAQKAGDVHTLAYLEPQNFEE